ncbi:hypothetical protein [Streptomyces sp. NPDC059015]|uniref:hypothetical protein n=1 Tax=unclassified Streptomyces TaxID=2593676 RepID=UPI0036A98131
MAELLPGGVRRERTYDGLGRLTGEKGTGAEAATTNRSFTYDLAGRMTAAGTHNVLDRDTFSYNDRGQLLASAGPGGDGSYTYDAEGNMTTRTTPGGEAYYGYDSAGRLDWTWDSITGSEIWYGFDLADRPTVERYATDPQGTGEWGETARRTFGYDDLGRLTSDRLTNPSGTTETASTAYDYDLDDRLTKKTTKGTAGAAENAYGYDRASRLTSWTKGTTTTAYTWDDAGNRVTAGARPPPTTLATACSRTARPRTPTPPAAPCPPSAGRARRPARSPSTPSSARSATARRPSPTIRSTECAGTARRRSPTTAAPTIL